MPNTALVNGAGEVVGLIDSTFEQNLAPNGLIYVKEVPGTTGVASHSHHWDGARFANKALPNKQP